MRDVPDYKLDPPEDDRKVIAVCEECGECIREGDDYYKFSFGCICEYCVNDARKVG